MKSAPLRVFLDSAETWKVIEAAMDNAVLIFPV
jgi:hypothetical protein